jgi:PHD/YefM family antitoxin component YafN of YafNO toxin-antitoxin module
MTRITANELQKEFKGTLNQVIREKERILLRRGREDVAAIMPIEDVRLLDMLIEEYEDRIDIEAARKALKDPGSISIEELKAELGL